MSRRDVIDDFRRFEENMNRMFEEIWGQPLTRRPLLSGETAGLSPDIRRPFVDIVETDKEVIATADMPGLEKGDININITDDLLEISAETKKEEEKKEKGYIYKERRSGSYYRKISLPSAIDPDNAKATYNNGVLEIKMPKIEVKAKKPLKIE